MKRFEWGTRPYIMGIINITPDSFSGDGVLTQPQADQQALALAKQFIQDGAHILDLGAESSRPGSERISVEIELERILPILTMLKTAGIQAPISIDTYKAESARACLENGADWINDIWGLKMDPDLAGVIAAFKATVVLMHNRSRSQAVSSLGELGKTYEGAQYSDIMDDIKADLGESVGIAQRAGITDENIILDPGIGFGKSMEQNLAIINRLEELKTMGFPILIGPSRKSFIGQVLGLPVDQREEGSAAAIALGVAHGADILRVHDVKRMARVAHMSHAIRNAR